MLRVRDTARNYASQQVPSMIPTGAVARYRCTWRDKRFTTRRKYIRSCLVFDNGNGKLQHFRVEPKRTADRYRANGR